MAAARIAEGGAAAWRLPPDARCASIGRSLVHDTLTALRLPGDLVDTAVLTASELATNALKHGLRPGPHAPVVPAELWIWGRTTPRPELVVAVFDGCRTAWPTARPDDLLAEHGKGLDIVRTVTGAWGAHRSRSRLGAGPGKAVWGAFPLGGPWRTATRPLTASAAAQYLAAALSARGVENVGHRHETRVSLVGIPLPGGDVLNVWARAEGFDFPEPGGARVHRPVADLQDVAEHLVCRVEEAQQAIKRPSSPLPPRGRRATTDLRADARASRGGSPARRGEVDGPG
ncbi:ATP-binding protein [Actinoallomurus rhizosphaericola]|uniref:ATP-binding protein n=1 Tax=Actinoallomurus rhizosphaericola TaxID=2952536 RepID=UPI0020921E54|nr:ATP-binding protein [Actinoallomurus rhizosphaericola]MCO5997225.1 ATP-binding protein [Actinoallomurus rhizosphaericola]